MQCACLINIPIVLQCLIAKVLYIGRLMDTFHIIYVGRRTELYVQDIITKSSHERKNDESSERKRKNKIPPEKRKIH